MNRLLPLLLYLGIGTVVLWQGLLPGYLFLLDMPWPDQFSLAHYTRNGLSPQLPWHILFSALALIIPSWLIQKLLLLAILTSIGLGMYGLASILSYPRRLALLSGGLALLNPFVFERLMVGQWLVLAGYAYMPFVIGRFLLVLDTPSQRNKIWFWLSYCILPIVSLHWWYITSALLLVMFVFYYTSSSKRPTLHYRQLILAASFFLFINSFWLVGTISTNSQLAAVSDQDFAAFQTRPDDELGLAINIINGYGFWYNEVVQPKDLAPLWFLSGILGIYLAQFGARRMRRSTSKQGRTHYTSFVLAMYVFTFFAFFLSLGYGNMIGRFLIDILLLLPGFKGLRETTKLIGVLMFFIALFAPYGLHKLKHCYSWQHTTAFLGVGLIIFISIFGMLFGARGQLRSYDYPPSYYDAREVLHSLEGPVLVLPWAGYLNIAYANNAFVANPAATFFTDIDLVIGSSTGNSLLDDQPDALDQAVLRPLSSDWAQAVRRVSGASYALILKTDAWVNYNSLITEESVLFDSSEISIITL